MAITFALISSPCLSTFISKQPFHSQGKAKSFNNVADLVQIARGRGGIHGTSLSRVQTGLHKTTPFTEGYVNDRINTTQAFLLNYNPDYIYQQSSINGKLFSSKSAPTTISQKQYPARKALLGTNDSKFQAAED